ncbi:MAG: uracil-DNA glycosylase [Deltaproteobacteria bacterium]|jgi:hypothetical protein|nr:uracil-DNA glycosylase [Deltaproteobacteria bacterium]MBQ33073.1 uracil-DNA glycosylase [Deltaproteobacteria bacterium]MDP7157920.1 uracil-DNA glycosylase [SAR324 cluster bacterium]MDP7464204.1 uracil-DNA glycosylase [SAR324 cluster bacterium]
MPGTARIRCIQCRHYQITWDPERPYGCEALNFKSRIEPSQYVFQTSGVACQSFEAKPTRKPLASARECDS